MADYWIEVSTLAAEGPWAKDMLREVGVEFLKAGPTTEMSVFWKVRDPGAPAELEGKTVMVTFAEEIHDPNARPPVYTHKITHREERTYL